MANLNKIEVTNVREQAISQLREMFPIGSTVHTMTRHITRSGMTQSISVVTAECSECRCAPRDVSWLVARALGTTEPSISRLS
jgi:exosome complex RNA-binding protein Csl4